MKHREFGPELWDASVTRMPPHGLGPRAALYCFLKLDNRVSLECLYSLQVSDKD